MAPKTNSKAVAGRAKKQENADKKNADKAAQAEAAEAAKWDQGAKKGKSAGESKAEKAAEAARKKAERERLLKEEEASLPSKPVKSAPKAGQKKTTAQSQQPKNSGLDEMITQMSASNIDDALDVLDVANEKTGDKAAMGSKAAQQVDTHPERRFKPALEAYKEREFADARKENPGLRKTQIDDILYKQFLKSPENPFNQLNVSYNATKDEKLGALAQKREQTTKRLGA